MNATERIAAAGITFTVGQTVIIPSFPSYIEHTLEDGDYVILLGDTLEVTDVAYNFDSAQNYSLEWDGTKAGHVIVQVTADGMEVMQDWRDEVADCWGFIN
jgi:hypothetical protein